MQSIKKKYLIRYFVQFITFAKKQILIVFLLELNSNFMFSIKELQDIISDKIKSLEYCPKPEGLYEPVKYILDIGGKRLRPALLLAACNVFSESIDNAVDTALAFEIFHNFTLLHDDVMDNSNLRRGNETVHVKWNVNTAILSGDAMMILAYGYILKNKSENLKSIFEIFNKTALEVCEGQQYDMNFETQKNVEIDDYLEMIKLKTSVLIAACIKSGAIIGGASSTDSDLLYDFGLNLGLAFQLQDDLLDVYGDSKVFGKQTGGDIVEAKKTFLLINALKNSDLKTNEFLNNLLEDKLMDRTSKVKHVTEIYNKLNIKQLTLNKINDYYLSAIKSLEKVNVESEKKKILFEIAEKLKVREN